MKIRQLFTACFLLLAPVSALAAPEPDPWPVWRAHDPESTLSVDHSAWTDFIAAHATDTGPEAVTRLRYGCVADSDREALDGYLERLQATPVSRLDRAEQFAFWVNLYNAGTVRVVLDHYPVESIRDIDISPGLFASGPWGAALFTVEGRALTLDDVEHRILRPIWGDPGIHYAVNCASIGCPDLLGAFTPATSQSLLEQGATRYVNHPRGARRDADGDLTVSSIYHWFDEDFGGTEAGVLDHLRAFAAPDKRARLQGLSGYDDHAYDWSLNDATCED